jgi:hypothetical protein
MFCSNLLALVFVSYAIHMSDGKALSPPEVVEHTDDVGTLNSAYLILANEIKFDSYMNLGTTEPIEQDIGGALWYKPNVLVTGGGFSADVFMIGIKRHSGKNLVIANSNVNLSSSEGCVRLKEMYFACTSSNLRSRSRQSSASRHHEAGITGTKIRKRTR